MDNDEFKKQAAKLYGWVYGDGESGRAFFVNGYVGHKISTNAGKLIITEAEGGNSDYAGDVIEISAEDIERMEFNEDDYQFAIQTTSDSRHEGQGYDIEVYTLERVCMEAV